MPHPGRTTWVLQLRCELGRGEGAETAELCKSMVGKGGGEGMKREDS